jgi:hypothetical protein
LYREAARAYFDQSPASRVDFEELEEHQLTLLTHLHAAFVVGPDALSD